MSFLSISLESHHPGPIETLLLFNSFGVAPILKIKSLNEKIFEQWTLLHKDDSIVTDENVQNLSSTIELRKLNKKIIPTWPFGSFTIVRYLTRILLPLVAPVFANEIISAFILVIINILNPTNPSGPMP